MDANFGGLDLSSFPQLQPPPPETSPLDDRFSKPYSSFHGLDSSRLREFLSAPDADALADLATADPEMAERVEDKVAQEAAEEFVRSNPDYLRTDLNFQTILDYLTNQYRSRDVDEFEDTDDAIRALVRVNAWTMTELTKAYRQLLRDGSLSIPANSLAVLPIENGLSVHSWRRMAMLSVRSTALYRGGSKGFSPQAAELVCFQTHNFRQRLVHRVKVLTSRWSQPRSAAVVRLCTFMYLGTKLVRIPLNRRRGHGNCKNASTNCRRPRESRSKALHGRVRE